ncbi:hypothetical protein [Actinoplanes sp. NPDC051851]|uniref:zf-HC2 domain-containing protein n=1 Tax=Actinoplanes sp. NPDC051851 TaxID=3154753 RepID=UPI00341B9003
MRASGNHTAAEQERLALYLIGALDSDDRESFEAHLADCWVCLNEATEIGASAAGLGLLDAADWDLSPDLASSPAFRDTDVVPDFLASPAPSARSMAAPSPAVQSPAITPDPVPAPESSPVSAKPAGSTRPGKDRPAGSRPPGRPGAARRRKRVATWAGAVAAVLVLALGGTAAFNQLTATDQGVVLSSSGEAHASGVSLSVNVTTGEHDASTIHLTVTGLHTGTLYRLYAVTRDGATHEVRDWTATTSPQTVDGETELKVDDISFVTVGIVGGAAVVTAPLH